MIEWIVSSSVLIVIVTLLRFLLKGKISLRLQYALWALVLIRLLVPVSFGQSGFSVMNAVTIKQTEYYVWYTGDMGAAKAEPDADGPVITPPISAAAPGISVGPYTGEVPANTAGIQLDRILRSIWITGIAVAAILFLFSNLHFAVRLRRSRQRVEHDLTALPVYVSEAVETPCLFGLFRPAIYVTPEVLSDETALRHVLAHETTHFRHGDHIWALLRCVCLALHWYNPLVWLAASLSRRDGELSCDEGAIKRIGEEERIEYGRTLIGLTSAKRGALLTTATTMTGSTRSIKERITLLAKKPKTAVYTLIAVFLLAGIAVGCTFTAADKEGEPRTGEPNIEEENVDDTATPTPDLTKNYIEVNGSSRFTWALVMNPVYVQAEDASDAYVRITVNLLENPDTASGYEITSVEDPAVIGYPDSPDVDIYDDNMTIESTTYDDAKQAVTIHLKFSTKKDFTASLSWNKDWITGEGSVTIRLREKAEGSVLLTEEEIAQVNEAFTPIMDNGEGRMMVNPLSCFFTSYYDKPESLNLTEFLRYFPFDEIVTDHAEFEALKADENWTFGADMTLDQMPVPIHKFSVAAINEVLEQDIGISIADLTGWKENDELLYLDEYDAYYNFTSDFGAGAFTCVRGEKLGDTVVLYSNGSILTLHRSGENYLVRSYLPMQSSPYSILQTS